MNDFREILHGEQKCKKVHIKTLERKYNKYMFIFSRLRIPTPTLSFTMEIFNNSINILLLKYFENYSS